MKKTRTFLDKMLTNLDKVDRIAIEQYVLGVNREKDFFVTVLDVLPFGVLILDTAKTVTYLNNAAKELLVRPNSEQRKKLVDVIADKKLLAVIDDGFKRSARIIDMYCDMMTPRHVRLNICLYPLYDEKGERCIAYVVCLHNLCVQDAQKQSERNEKIHSLTALAAGIAHEIGNPLNAITIHLEVMRQQLLQKDIDGITSGLSVLVAETKRLDTIVKEFLKVTRGRSLYLKMQSINECVQRAVSFLSLEIKERKCQLTTLLSKEIPEFYFDDAKIYEVVLNLIKNSLEAMPEGGEMEIQSVFKEKVVSIIFRDTGIGIEESKLPYIFDAYYTTKPNGSGLGLMNVFTIVKMHEGRIHVESKKDHGTVIVIHLPFKQDILQLPYNGEKEDSI